MSEAGPNTPPEGAPAAQPPGAPPADEFAGIPSPPRRPPVLAAVAVALALFLAWQVRHDLAYALSSSTAQDLGAPATLAARTDLPVDRYVRIAGPLDRESAIILDTRGSWQFTQFMRLLGTNSRVFVRRAADPLPVSLAERDVFTGRLVPLSRLSFESAIRQHFSQHVTATHIFSPDQLRAAITGGGSPLVVRDRAGESVTLAAHDELLVDVLQPGVMRVEMPRERFVKPADARAAIEKAGLQVLSEGEPVRKGLTFLAAVPPAARDAALSALGDLDRRVSFRPARTTDQVRVRELAFVGDELRLTPAGGATTSVRAADVGSVRIVAPVRIPEQAFLLVEGERPRDQSKALLVIAFLLAFATVHLLALRRSV